jgi:hypothetical protein
MQVVVFILPISAAQWKMELKVERNCTLVSTSAKGDSKQKSFIFLVLAEDVLPLVHFALIEVEGVAVAAWQQ